MVTDDAKITIKLMLEQQDIDGDNIIKNIDDIIQKYSFRVNVEDLRIALQQEKDYGSARYVDLDDFQAAVQKVDKLKLNYRMGAEARTQQFEENYGFVASMDNNSLDGHLVVELSLVFSGVRGFPVFSHALDEFYQRHLDFIIRRPGFERVEPVGSVLYGAFIPYVDLGNHEYEISLRRK